MISSQATSQSHIPTSLDLPEFDDDDVFDAEDSKSLPYVFSPEAIREDMARNVSETQENWGEASTASTGEFLIGSRNTSVSTLDINLRTNNGFDHFTPTSENSLDSALSSHFSQISLDTPDEEYAPHRVSFSDPILSPSEGGDLTSSKGQDGVSEVTTATLISSPKQHQKPSLKAPLSSHADSSISNPHNSRGSVDTISSTSPTPSSPAASISQTAAPTSLPAILPSLLSPTGLLTEKPRSHVPHRSSGPSAFEKVRSKTRPTFLPPKPKREDEKHMADWQQMMKQSRAMAEKRHRALQERRLAREKAIEDDLHIWEKEILPDWRVVNKKPEFRKLWWNGIPTKLRAPLWEKAVGNELALSKDHYRTCLSRAKRALKSGTFPPATLDLIGQDMLTTLPAIHIFNQENGPLHADLKDMLCAWVVSRSDEGLGYNLGAAKIAAMLLINLPSPQAFIVMRNLLERHCMRSFFGGERAKDDVEAYYRIFDTLLADGMPKIYFNFKQHQISPGAYLHDWAVSLFLDHLPFEACARIWDVLLLEGDSFLFRASLGILAVLEPRLFFPDKKELLELLKGENKAAIEVAKREGRPLNGGKYEIYGVDEENLWDRIDAMEDWWKDSTWTRLIQRELPDL